MADKANFIGCLDLNCHRTVGLHRLIADTGAITDSSSRGYHRSRAIADNDSLVDTTSFSIDSSADAGAFVHSDPFTNSHPHGYAKPDTLSHGYAPPDTHPNGHGTPDTHSHCYATPNTDSQGHAKPHTHFHGHATPDTGFHFRRPRASSGRSNS